MKGGYDKCQQALAHMGYYRGVVVLVVHMRSPLEANYAYVAPHAFIVYFSCKLLPIRIASEAGRSQAGSRQRFQVSQ
jgi:hypothetical protein